jgi:hypothetical protein
MQSLFKSQQGFVLEIDTLILKFLEYAKQFETEQIWKTNGTRCKIYY